MLSSQVALDRMATYLFAIVVTAVIISTLYLTGFFSPQKPQAATGFLETPVIDFSLSAPTSDGMQEFIVNIGNSIKSEITINKIKLSKNGNAVDEEVNINVAPGGNKKIKLLLTPPVVFGDVYDDFDIMIDINYTNLKTGIAHVDSGYLNGKLVDPGLIVSLGAGTGGQERPSGNGDVENHTYSGEGVDFYFADVIDECRPHHCAGPELVVENERLIVVFSNFETPTPKLNYLDYPIWIFSKETGHKYGTVGVLDDNGELFSGTWINSIDHPNPGNYPNVSLIYHTRGAGCGGCLPSQNRRDIIFTLGEDSDYLSWTIDNLPGNACHCGGAFIYDYPEVSQVWVSYSEATNVSCSNTTIYPENAVVDNQAVKVGGNLCTWYSPAQTVPATYPVGVSVSAGENGIFGFIMELHNLGTYSLQASSGTNNLLTQYVTETFGWESPISHHAILATRGDWEDIFGDVQSIDIRSGTFPKYFKTPLIRVNGTVQTLDGAVNGTVVGTVAGCSGSGNVTNGEYEFAIDCDLEPGHYLIDVKVVARGEAEETQVPIDIP